MASYILILLIIIISYCYFYYALRGIVSLFRLLVDPIVNSNQTVRFLVDVKVLIICVVPLFAFADCFPYFLNDSVTFSLVN